jgi:CBS-domain-containing membrane protein
MTDASEQHPAPLPATVADVMHPPVTAVNQNDHVAAAAYLVTSGRFRHLPVMGTPAWSASWTSPTYAARCSTYQRPRRSHHLIRSSMRPVGLVRRDPYPQVRTC